MSDEADLEQLGINVIRGLAMDAPQKADSGHPGTAMALAPLAHVLFTRIMHYDPSAPEWPDRDRFVLSAGHACILLYSMLFLTGYDLTLDDIKQFRQWGSRTPGHPEHRHTKGVDVTTGPLGQGFGNGVGMGLAERWLRAKFGPDLVDHHTFVICSDGDLMEGLSHEAASLAGHLGLGRLIYVYDDNHISIDGPTELAYSDDVPMRFEAYGWHVEDLGGVANEPDTLEAALRRAVAEEDKPSMLVLRSHIGWPAPGKMDTAAAHGSPLGEDEIRVTKEILGLPPDESFWVPDAVLDMYRRLAAPGRDARHAWEARFEAWQGDRAAWDACQQGAGLDGWAKELPNFEPGKELATRRAMASCLSAVQEKIPGLMAGSADLTGNTGVKVQGATNQSSDEPQGIQIHYGIREHAMGATMTGLALHGGTLPIGGTFFVFSDYMRPSVRLAALSGAHVIYSWTHDSVGLGEDGPTHQPIEQPGCHARLCPGLRVIRPADANETAHALRVAVDGEGPTALVLSRQDVPVLPGTADAADGVARGAYILHDSAGAPDVVLVATGSEVHLCIDAVGLLAGADGGDPVAARVVSFPSWDLFEAQEPAYRAGVLPAAVPTLAVEAAASFGWDRYADDTLGIDHFGESAPGATVLTQFGFTPDNVAARARRLLARGAP